MDLPLPSLIVSISLLSWSEWLEQNTEQTYLIYMLSWLGFFYRALGNQRDLVVYGLVAFAIGLVVQSFLLDTPLGLISYASIFIILFESLSNKWE